MFYGFEDSCFAKFAQSPLALAVRTILPSRQGIARHSMMSSQNEDAMPLPQTTTKNIFNY